MNLFSGNPLDRVARKRLDPEWLAACLEDADSRFLPFWRLNVLVKQQGPAIGWARRGLLSVMDESVGAVLLGVRDSVAHFAVDISAMAEPLRELGLDGVADFYDVRSAAVQLSGEECAVVAQGRALVDWHSTHRFCARCGAATVSVNGGAMRTCATCSAEHFPRVNPVAIMLVLRGDQCLLGRQAAWPRGMYSALAGFIEPGETIEEAVRREVMEEAGIEVGEVRYHSSQPWPFPSSLMIGCTADATSSAIHIDEMEIEDARWFSRETVARACRGETHADELFLPPPMAIARTLVDAWLADV
ncbi:MAG: NAD(+) diphosphatase [Deltaproteobacteria bacterium]|nr:NAD(+) diphosphatase [Deltaproteobacteria bacterium]